MSSAVGEGGAKLDTGTALGFLGICAGLASTTTGSGCAAFGISGANSSLRSYLAFVTTRFALLLADFDGDSDVLPNLTILSFTFLYLFIKVTLFNKGLFLFSNQSCFCAKLCINRLYNLLDYDIFIVIESIFKLKIG